MDLAARLPLPLTDTPTIVPARVYTADTPAHVDADRTGVPFAAAHLVYLTPSPGELYVGNDDTVTTTYSLDTPGHLITIPTGTRHGTRGTGTTTRISIGPFNEAGRAVGCASGTLNYYAADRLTILQDQDPCVGIPFTILDFTAVGGSIPVGQRFLGWTNMVDETNIIGYATGDTSVIEYSVTPLDLYPIFVTPPPSGTTFTSPSIAVLSTANAMVNASAETASVGGLALVRARRDNPSMRFPDHASYLRYQQGIARAQIRRAAGPQRISTAVTVPKPPRINDVILEPAATFNNGTALISFSADPDSGGPPILFFTVRAYTSVSGLDILYNIQRSQWNEDVLFIGLSPLSVNIPYTVRMTATNAAGTSAWSAPSNSFTLPGVPTEPLNVVATPGDEEITISFDEPANDGGFLVQYYLAKTFLYVDNTPAAPDVSGSLSSIPVTGLTNGTEYYIKLYAVNQNGPGRSATTEPVIPQAPTVPATPELTVTPQNTALSVSIAFPSDGGESIMSFSWWYSDGSTTTPPTEVSFSGSPATITISDLTNGTPYTVFVTAANSVGTSNVGTAAGTPADIPPELLRFDPSIPSSYSGSGSTVTSIGTANISGTTNFGVSYTNNLVGGAFLFNGTGSITFNNFDFGQAFTVVAWVNPSLKASINAVLANETSGNNNMLNGFKLGWNSYNTIGASNRFLVFEGKGGGASTGTATITYSEWQQIGYVMNITGNTVNFYKNATQIGSQGTLPTAVNPATTKGFRIGTFTDGSFGMSGYLADIRVYPAALTQEQLQIVYDSTRGRYGL
jgi:hypothetical protein